MRPRGKEGGTRCLRFGVEGGEVVDVDVDLFVDEDEDEGCCCCWSCSKRERVRLRRGGWGWGWVSLQRWWWFRWGEVRGVVFVVDAALVEIVMGLCSDNGGDEGKDCSCDCDCGFGFVWILGRERGRGRSRWNLGREDRWMEGLGLEVDAVVDDDVALGGERRDWRARQVVWMLAFRGEVGVCWVWVGVVVREGEKEGEKRWEWGGKKKGEGCDGASQGRAEGRSIFFCCLFSWGEVV